MERRGEEGKRKGGWEGRVRGKEERMGGKEERIDNRNSNKFTCITEEREEGERKGWNDEGEEINQ